MAGTDTGVIWAGAEDLSLPEVPRLCVYKIILTLLLFSYPYLFRGFKGEWGVYVIYF